MPTKVQLQNQYDELVNRVFWNSNYDMKALRRAANERRIHNSGTVYVYHSAALSSNFPIQYIDPIEYTSRLNEAMFLTHKYSWGD